MSRIIYGKYRIIKNTCLTEYMSLARNGVMYQGQHLNDRALISFHSDTYIEFVKKPGDNIEMIDHNGFVHRFNPTKPESYHAGGAIYHTTANADKGTLRLIVQSGLKEHKIEYKFLPKKSKLLLANLRLRTTDNRWSTLLHGLTSYEAKITYEKFDEEDDLYDDED